MEEYFELFEAELNTRMALPQRHRLLHGYPMAPLMEPCVPKLRRFKGFEKEKRGLILGVLPHPFCNPKVEGCGFCTFPHSQFNKGLTEKCCDAVIEEIRRFKAAHSVLCERPITALYFGGGTANLTPWSKLEEIIETLSHQFHIRDAELTLEGVPIYFARENFKLLEQLSGVKQVRHKRISMGLQSFQAKWLKVMGREAFGDAAVFGSIVEACHERGLTLSCDLLCNLPGQSLEEMKADLSQAIDLSFDQICLYHLVLFKGLPVPWAKDKSMLGALPNNEAAYENWRQLRAQLLEAGYIQTSLTNFERAEVYQSEQRFVYEDASYRPLSYDFLGFGPGAISSLSKWWQDEPIFFKSMNPSAPDTYIDNVQRYGTGHDKRFYGLHIDPILLFLTRSFAKLGFQKSDYPHDGLRENFPEAYHVLHNAGLILDKLKSIELTEKGMFYADTVVGLLAWPRTQHLRGLDSLAAEIDQERAFAFGADFSMG